MPAVLMRTSLKPNPRLPSSLPVQPRNGRSGSGAVAGAAVGVASGPGEDEPFPPHPPIRTKAKAAIDDTLRPLWPSIGSSSRAIRPVSYTHLTLPTSDLV